MARKITVTLNERATKMLNELMYSLDTGSNKPVTLSECINWALEAHADFESLTGEDVVGYLQRESEESITTGIRNHEREN